MSFTSTGTSPRDDSLKKSTILVFGYPLVSNGLFSFEMELRLKIPLSSSFYLSFFFGDPVRPSLTRVFSSSILSRCSMLCPTIALILSLSSRFSAVKN